MDIALNIILWLVVAILAGFTVIPMLPVHHGFIRGWDFPRQQFLLIAIGMIPAVLWAGIAGMWVAVAIMLFVIASQFFQIGRYLPIWHLQSKEASADELEAGSKISLLAANVKKSNRDYDKLLTLARERQPDILMAIEVDDDWCDALADLNDIYPYRACRPLDNGYGMAIFSQLEIDEPSFLERVTEGVPSFKACVKTRKGQTFRLHVIHPEPPVPDHDTIGRDAEVAHVALDARDDDLPVIVSGDLNDVAWSSNTRHFQQISQLLDPRVGRGFYNTFSATHPIMRWPLDQLFHSQRFRYVNMERMRKIGSDHFPMLFELVLVSEPDAVDTPDDIGRETIREVKEAINNEKSRDREAIGSHWEDED